MRQPRIYASSFLIALGISCCLVCKHAEPPPTSPLDIHSTTINLGSVITSAGTQTFHEVDKSSLLPKAVLDQFGGPIDFNHITAHAFGGMADPGQPFNSTDVMDSKDPTRQLVVAALSQQYCLVTYWRGGITLRLQTAIFELSGDHAKVIWISVSEGGLNFQDLKEMVESGRMHNQMAHTSL
jgi:hypothetical protein